MSDRLPPGLEEFGQRLRQAAAAQIEEDRHQAEPSRRRASRTRRLTVALCALVLTGAVAAGAGRLLAGEGDPLLGDPASQRDYAAGTATGVVASTATPDPVGGLPWAVRVFTNADGEECVAVGRLRNGELGQIEGRIFRPLADDVPGICDDVSARRVIVSVEQRKQPASRTAVFGLSTGSSPVDILVDGQSYRVQPRGFGAFLLVVEGVRGERSLSLRTRVDNRVVSLTVNE